MTKPLLVKDSTMPGARITLPGVCYSYYSTGKAENPARMEI